MRNASIANSSGPPVVFGSCVSPDSGVLGILFIRLSLTRLSTNGGAVTMGSPLGFRCAERRTGYSKQRGEDRRIFIYRWGIVKRKPTEERQPKGSNRGRWPRGHAVNFSNVSTGAVTIWRKVSKNRLVFFRRLKRKVISSK